MRNSFLLNLDINEVTLEDILKFITGCPTIPVIGFERKILVKFEHDCPDNCNCYPVASTCQAFTAMMTGAIKNCGGILERV